MYGIWAYLSCYSRVGAFICKLGSGSRFPSGRKDGCGSASNKNLYLHLDPHQIKIRIRIRIRVINWIRISIREWCGSTTLPQATACPLILYMYHHTLGYCASLVEISVWVVLHLPCSYTVFWFGWRLVMSYQRFFKIETFVSLLLSQ